MMGRMFRCLLKRELRALFYTPLAYAILFFLLDVERVEFLLATAAISGW